MYDLMGNVHGRAGGVERLDAALGYKPAGGAYRHPARTAVFLGDFIDRGPQIRRVLGLE